MDIQLEAEAALYLTGKGLACVADCRNSGHIVGHGGTSRRGKKFLEEVFGASEYEAIYARPEHG